jgi:hypothetical protein
MGVIMADARGIRGESFLPSGDIHREAPEYAFLKAELPKWAHIVQISGAKAE